EEDRVLDLAPVVRREDLGCEIAGGLDRREPRLEPLEQAREQGRVAALRPGDALVELVALGAERVDEGRTGHEREELAVVGIEGLHGHRWRNLAGKEAPPAGQALYGSLAPRHRVSTCMRATASLLVVLLCL